MRRSASGNASKWTRPGSHLLAKPRWMMALVSWIVWPNWDRSLGWCGILIKICFYQKRDLSSVAAAWLVFCFCSFVIREFMHVFVGTRVPTSPWKYWPYHFFQGFESPWEESQSPKVNAHLSLYRNVTVAVVLTLMFNHVDFGKRNVRHPYLSHIFAGMIVIMQFCFLNGPWKS